MKTITLEKLVLTNYRNIEHQEFEFSGNSKIVGENRIGKTNTLEAIHYLLTDKLIGNDSDITRIKPLSDTKKLVTVQGTFDIDGEKLELKKEYGENWVKVRNTQEVVLKGNETTYYINSIKQSTLKEYNRQIEEKFGFKNDINKIDLTQLLINPFYIGEMGDSEDWTHLREFIIKLVGDVTDDDVFRAEPITLPIKEDLARASGKIDQIKKLYKGTADGLKANVQSFESQISLLEKTECPMEDTIEVAKKAIDEIESNISQLRSKNGADLVSASIKEKIANKKAEIANAKLEASKSNQNTAFFTAQNELKELVSQHQETLIASSNEITKIGSLNNRKSWLEQQMKESEMVKQENVKEYNRLVAERMNPNVDLECPTCHRKYEQQEIEKILANYVLGINNKIEELKKKGAVAKAIRTSTEEELKALNQEVAQKEEEHKQTLEKLKQLAEEVNKKREEVDKFSVPNEVVDPAVTKLEEELKTLEQDLIKATNDFNASVMATSEAIAAEQEKLPKYRKVIDDKAYYDRQMETLKKVKADLEKTKKDLIAVEQKNDLVNTFTKRKLTMLDENISKVFGNIKFQLLQETISGGFNTICKPYIYDPVADKSSDVIWKSGSKSEMVATGIAIVERIKETLNLPNLPFLFDEGGEISTDTFSTRFKTNSQIICVKVQDNIQQPLVMAI